MFPEGRAVLSRVAASQLQRELERCGEVRRNEPLARHTTFRVGGIAAYYALPESPDALSRMIAVCRAHSVPHIIIGAGSNILFSDSGYSGVVITTARLNTVTIAPPYVDVGAGVPLAVLLERLHSAGFHSLDFLAGIPGTVGGAIAMNAGIPARTIATAVTWVQAIDNKKTVQFDRSAARFTYRGSLFRTARLPIIAARLRVDGPRYDAAALIARRSVVQPTSSPSAGCVFKNPPTAAAGKLIDDAGLKGLRVGMAMVSEKHANFILNLGGARSADIRKIIDIVREKVYKSFRISLELEIEVIDG